MSQRVFGQLLPVIRLARDDEKSVVRNIDQYYVYEFSRLMPEHYSLGADGSFHDEDYDRYWSKPDHFPYLIFNDKELAGFALVQRNVHGFNLDQFFIVAKYQGSGIAEQTAGMIFDSHSGPWRVQSFLGNERSERFWARVITGYTKGDFSLGLVEPKRTHHEYTFSAHIC